MYNSGPNHVNWLLYMYAAACLVRRRVRVDVDARLSIRTTTYYKPNKKTVDYDDREKVCRISLRRLGLVSIYGLSGGLLDDRFLDILERFSRSN